VPFFKTQVLPAVAATPICEIAQGDALLQVVPEPVDDTYFVFAVFGAVIVNEAKDSALSSYPIMNALVFITALLVNAIVPVYKTEDWVGVEPFVV
jgi:hypothetical protein